MASRDSTPRRGIGPDGREPTPATVAADPGRAAPAPAPLQAGTRLGQFELGVMIGRGGMGAVYKATDLALGRSVAVKILSPALAGRAGALARFRQEAQAASRVLHANVVTVFAFGVDQDIPFLAMEYLRGETLAAAIARGPLSVDRTADVMLGVCAGVFAAHRSGVVHRDLKPSNIFLADGWLGETPKVLDFGISKLREGGAALTGSGDVVGTWKYLSPEQAMCRRDVDPRSDQYGLGVILYECVTGETPHHGKAAYQAVRDIVEGRFPPPRARRADLPEAFEAVIMKALQTTPEARHATVHDLGGALLAFASERARRQWGDHYGTPEAATAPAPSVPMARTARLEATGAAPSWRGRPTQTVELGTPSGLVAIAPEPTPPKVGRGRRPLAAVLIAVAAVAIAALALMTRPRAPTARVIVRPATTTTPVPAPAPASRATAAVSRGVPPGVPVLAPQPPPVATPSRPSPSRTVRRGNDRRRTRPAPIEVQYTPEGIPIL